MLRLLDVPQPMPVAISIAIPAVAPAPPPLALLVLRAARRELSGLVDALLDPSGRSLGFCFAAPATPTSASDPAASAASVSMAALSRAQAQALLVHAPRRARLIASGQAPPPFAVPQVRRHAQNKRRGATASTNFPFPTSFMSPAAQPGALPPSLASAIAAIAAARPLPGPGDSSSPPSSSSAGGDLTLFVELVVSAMAEASKCDVGSAAPLSAAPSAGAEAASPRFSPLHARTAHRELQSILLLAARALAGASLMIRPLVPPPPPPPAPLPMPPPPAHPSAPFQTASALLAASASSSALDRKSVV